MLKTLMLRKKLEGYNARMAELNQRTAELATREGELETAMNEAQTEEELRSVEELVTAFTEEQRSHQEAVSALQAEIDAATEELRSLESQPPPPPSGDGEQEKNQLFTISPDDGMVRLLFNEGSTPIAETAVNLQPGQTYSFTYLQEGSVGTFYIDGQAALTVRIYGASGKTIQLFAENNTVAFTSLREYTRP